MMFSCCTYHLHHPTSAINSAVSLNTFFTSSLVRCRPQTPPPPAPSSPLRCGIVSCRSLRTKYLPGRTTKAAWRSFLAKTKTSLTVAVSLVAGHASNRSCRSRNFRNGNEIVITSVSNVSPNTVPSLSLDYAIIVVHPPGDGRGGDGRRASAIHGVLLHGEAK